MGKQLSKVAFLAVTKKKPTLCHASITALVSSVTVQVLNHSHVTMILMTFIIFMICFFVWNGTQP